MPKYASLHPHPVVPAYVAMVMLGPSSRDWNILSLSRNCTLMQEIDEVWTCNRGIRIFRHDLAFVMDDLRGEANNDPPYGINLETHSVPFFTSAAYTEYPMAMPYPLTEVCEHTHSAGHYLHNTLPYMLAYALTIGVERVLIAGADYTSEDGRVREEDRANAEYWVGYCRAMGMMVGTTASSTLLNTHRIQSGSYWYGYADQRHARRLAHAAGPSDS